MTYRGFPGSLVEKIVCQKCLGELRPITKQEFIVNGELRCIRCKNIHEIQEGILRLLEHEALDPLRKSEIKSRDEDARRYEARLTVRYEKEVVPTLAAIGDTAGKNIIEYGAGTGRISQYIIGKSKSLLAVDFSADSLKVFAKTKVTNETVGLVHADATQIRTRPECFDIAIATQFYEHIPTQELRNAFLSNCKETLVVNGRFISTTYHYDLRMRLRGKAQEGMHPTGIFYHYYTKQELQKEISRYFRVDSLRPIDITLPLEARFAFAAKFGGVVSRTSEYILGIRDFGHLLLVIGVKTKSKYDSDSGV